MIWHSEQGGTYYLRMSHSNPQIAGDGVSYLIQLQQGNLIFLPNIYNGE